MPVWLVKYLPYGIVVIVVLLGIWFIQDWGRGQQKLVDDAREQRQIIRDQEYLRKTNAALDAAAAKIDQNFGRQIGSIEEIKTTVLQPMIKEIRSEVRYSSPDCALTGGVYNALEQARERVNVEIVNGGTTVELPPDSRPQ